MKRRLAATLMLAVIVVAGCVGPATTTAAYRGKAVHASEAALSAVATTTLATRTLLRGNLFESYAEVLIVESEDALASIQGQFDSIQPPDDTVSDKLRSTLDAVLASGSGYVAAVRIAVRRGHLDKLPDLAKSLDAVAKKLQAFSADHG